MITWYEHILHIIFPPTRDEEAFYERAIHGTLPPPRKSLYPWLTSCMSYKSPLVKRVIHIIKKRQSSFLSRIFAKIIFTKLAHIHHDISEIIIIPIPLDSHRKRTRGYNQSAYIAEALSKYFDVPYCESILSKSIHTQKQALISDQYMRKENVTHSFTAHYDDAISHDRPLCILDDVTTTGATVYDARRALLEAGYTHVYALTLAH